MSELKTKLEYLKETKNLIKEQLIAKGQPIDDNTTFREYVDNMNDLVDTTDANAIEDDLALNKTAYANGEKITGTIPELTPYTGVLTMNQNGIGSDGDGTIGYLSSSIDKDTIVRKGTNVSIMADNDSIADIIGLTADKIVKGNSFLGINGTAETGGSQINNQDKTIAQNGTYTADSGYTGLGEVTVNVPSLDTSDATATVNDITEGKTAYVNGNKITGTYIEDPNKLYFFGSVSEMEQSTKIQNGVQSIVLTEILNEINTASIFDELVFPEQIVMRTPITSSFSTSFRRTDNNSTVKAYGNRTQFSFISQSCIKYTSTNGITYNRTTFTIPGNFGTITGDTVKFVTSFKYDSTGWCDEVSKFLRTKSYQSDLYLKENDDFTLIEAQKNKLLDLSKLYYHDTDVTYYKLSNIFDTSHIKDVTSMFDSCTNLVTCDLSNLDFSNITSLATMFWGCINLTTIVFPSTIDTSKVTTMAELFGSHGRFCPKLDDNSLNSILLMCANATSYTGTKTLRYLGITSAEATTCQSLSNYQDFINAGWATGY